MDDSKKKVLKVDIEELIRAMTDNNSLLDSEYYLDLETGEILWLNDDMEPEEYEELDEMIENDEEGRYLYIEKTESYIAYDDMVDFAGTIEDDRLRELLSVALNGKGAFRRFKDVLYSDPSDEIKRWYEFRDKLVTNRQNIFLSFLSRFQNNLVFGYAMKLTTSFIWMIFRNIIQAGKRIKIHNLCKMLFK